MTHTEKAWALWHPSYGFNFDTINQDYDLVWMEVVGKWGMPEPKIVALGYLVIPITLSAEVPG